MGRHIQFPSKRRHPNPPHKILLKPNRYQIVVNRFIFIDDSYSSSRDLGSFIRFVLLVANSCCKVNYFLFYKLYIENWSQIAFSVREYHSCTPFCLAGSSKLGSGPRWSNMSIILLASFLLFLVSGSADKHAQIILPDRPNTWGNVVVRNGKFMINFTSEPGRERYYEVCGLQLLSSVYQCVISSIGCRCTHWLVEQTKKTPSPKTSGSRSTE